MLQAPNSCPFNGRVILVQWYDGTTPHFRTYLLIGTSALLLRSKLLHRVLDLESLLNSVKRSNPLGYGRITYMTDLTTCNLVLHLMALGVVY